MGWFVVATSAFLAVFAYLLLPEYVLYRRLLLAGLLTGGILGLLILLWEERLLIDVPTGTYQHTKGRWLLQRVQRGTLDSLTRLVLRVYTSLDIYGGVVRRYTLILEQERVYFALFRNWPENPAMEAAYRIAAQLNRPLEEAPMVGGRQRSGLAGGVLLWGGLVGAFAVMLWPVLSGSRPLWRTEEARFRRSPGVPLPAAGFSAFDSGNYLYSMGDYAGAETQFRAALRQFPRWADAYNMLAYALAEQGKLDEALETARIAHYLAPRSGYITDTVAEMHERRGELFEAAKYYVQALKELPESETTETHAKYGRTLLALGQRAEGIVHLKKAARDPSEPYGRKARQMLAELGMRVNPSP
jgi:tetratricopeptide (TPR) repeat protein